MPKWFPRWLVPVGLVWVVLRSSAVLQFSGTYWRRLLMAAFVLDFVIAAGLVLMGYRLYKHLKLRRSLEMPLPVKTNGYPEVVPLPVSTPLQPAVARPCPNCGTNLNPLDSLCYYCRVALDPWFRRNGFWWRHTERGDQWLDERLMQWREWEQV